MRLRLLVSALFLSGAVMAQSGYDLQFRIDGLKDTTVWLGYYYGETTYRKDTAVVSSLGEFGFQGEETLPQGVYLIALNKSRLLEFVVGNDQHFSMETDTAGYVEDMRGKGDHDNTIFFENMRFNMDRHD